MYFKLSFKNVKKSFNNYLLYFSTLAFAVCIFYVFNSIEAQQAMLNLSELSTSIMQSLVQLIGMLSIFISFILGFLIVFANNFLINRRKKELGLYLTLGMNKSKIARLLMIETFFVGVFSLGAGLVLGIFGSQWLSIFTAKLFEADMTKYTFLFSSSAFFKTIVYFSIIFIIAMLVSIFSISKYKLIDLIEAHKKNEKPKLRSVPLTMTLFVLSLGFLFVAYRMVIKNGLYFDDKLAIAMILGTVGTFLFFASLSGFFLRLIQSNQKCYYKGLNMFVLRQVNNRVNTAFISMSFICLMLFFSISILSGGLGINTVLNAVIKNSTPFDVSILRYDERSIQKDYEGQGIDFSKYTDDVYEYQKFQIDGLNHSEVLLDVKDYLPKILQDDNSLMDMPLNVIRLSDYNTAMKKIGKQSIILSEESVALHSDFMLNSDTLNSILNQYVAQGDSLMIQNHPFSVYPEVLTDSMSTATGDDVITLIVPDVLCDQAQPVATIMNFNFNGNSVDMQKEFENDTLLLNDNAGHFAMKNDIKDSYTGTKALISYIGIYLGIIFLVVSSATLALQQLSEIADNRQRYEILIKIGADSKMINRAIFKQVAVYFSLPLILAAIHSVVGLYVISDMIMSLGDVNIAANIILTVGLFLVFYGAYFLATYYGGKRFILRNKL